MALSTSGPRRNQRTKSKEGGRTPRQMSHTKLDRREEEISTKLQALATDQRAQARRIIRRHCGHQTTKVEETLAKKVCTRAWHQEPANLAEDGIVGPFNFPPSMEKLIESAKTHGRQLKPVNA